jgi:superfamily II DNA helicase RecQ
MKKMQAQPSNRMWQDGQTCQRVFRAVGWPAYMVVRAGLAVSQPADISHEVVSSWRNDQEKRQARQAQTVIRDSHRVKVDPWLELTAWVPHLKGFSPLSLLEAREIPDDSRESELGVACNAMRRVVRRAFHSCRFEVVGRHTLELIERRETGAPSNEKPFYARQRMRTIRKYTRTLLNVFCYLWRTHRRTERPPYRLSGLQESALLQAQQSIEQGDRTALEKHCLQLWIWLLDHTLLADEHESGLLSGVAVLGLKPDSHGGGWVPAHHFSSTLSALVTTSKALVVYYAYCQREEAAGAAGADSAPSTSELVGEMSTRSMVLSDYSHTATPMNRLLRLRALARSESRRRNADGVLSWSGDRLLINQQSFSLDDLRSTVKGLYETARMQLLKDVLLLELDARDQIRPGTTMLPELNLDRLVDQPADMSTGYSFLRHPDNNLESWQTWLLFRVVEEPALRERFISGMDATQQPPRTLWHDAAVAAYMKAVRRFKETLFALVHLSGGGPARGTEITSIQCENSTEGVGHRGVFVDAGLVSFVATYHKGYDLSKKVKAIHRYVPREVSELVVYFLGLGRPFIDDLQMMHYNVDEPTTFFWEPLPDEQEEEEDEDSDEGEDANEDEEGREDKKAVSANPDGYWGTDRIRRVLKEQTSRHMAAALNTQSWRHAYPAIHRKLATDGKARDWLDVLYFNKEPEQDDAQARQSGHTAETEECNYGRSLAESPFQTMAERVKFWRVSEDWHRILEFQSALGAEPCRAGHYAAVMAQQEKQARERWSSLAVIDLKPEFRRLTGNPAAEYRGRQEESLRAIMQHSLRLLVVMATGMGKSMLFMLPVSVSSGGVTIVISPLKLLQDDMLDCCDQLGIPSARWDGRRPPYWAKIVFTTPEGAATKSFGRFLDEKRTLRQLDRIVIDECHTMFESTEAWRPDVLRLSEMTSKGTQLVYLTATMPPVLQPAFLDLAGLDSKELDVIRDESTTRHNLAYQVQEYVRGELDATVVDLVAAKRARYGANAQILIYCPSVAETKRMGKLLQCSAYYREMATDEEKAYMVRAFTAGVEKLCTATTILTLGIHAPGVRVVIHMTMCDLLMNLVQESGRAGREGDASESIVLQACWGQGTTRGKSLGYRLEQRAKDYLSETVCRRIVIDRYMDGRGDRRGCEVGEAWCDLCEANPRGTKRQKQAESQAAAVDAVDAADAVDKRRRKLEQAQCAKEQEIELIQRRKTEQTRYELERVEQHLQRWVGVCAICMAVKGTREQHEWEECPAASEEQVEAMRVSCRQMQRVKWALFAKCNYCWAPQAICNKWVEDARTQGGYQSLGGRVGCQFHQVLPQAVGALLAFQGSVCRPWVEKQMQLARVLDGSEEVRQRQWLGQKMQIGQRNASRMCSLLYAWEEGYIYQAK